MKKILFYPVTMGIISCGGTQADHDPPNILWITHEGPINALRSSNTESLQEFSDRDQAQLSPYLPDSPKMREIWAHMNDLLAVFDQEVKDLLDQLREDGLHENKGDISPVNSHINSMLDDPSPIFIGVALDQSMINCGMDVEFQR